MLFLSSMSLDLLLLIFLIDACRVLAALDLGYEGGDSDLTNFVTVCTGQTMRQIDLTYDARSASRDQVTPIRCHYT
jgi:hypothetical protein